MPSSLSVWIALVSAIWVKSGLEPWTMRSFEPAKPPLAGASVAGAAVAGASVAGACVAGAGVAGAWVGAGVGAAPLHAAIKKAVARSAPARAFITSSPPPSRSVRGDPMHGKFRARRESASNNCCRQRFPAQLFLSFWPSFVLD
jgi:hypothetical protein